MTIEKTNEAPVKPTGKRTLTLGTKSKEALKKLQETAEQKVGGVDIRKQSLKLKTSLGGAPAIKRPILARENLEAAKEHNLASGLVDDGLTDSERLSRLAALEKARGATEQDGTEPPASHVTSFQVVETVVVAPVGKPVRKPSAVPERADKNKEERPESEGALFGKKKTPTKKKDKNNNESVWKTQYYQEEEEDLEDNELVDESSFLAEQEATAASLEAAAQSDNASIAPNVNPFVTYGQANVSTKRFGKTRRDRKTTLAEKEKRSIVITGEESIKTLAHMLGERLKTFTNVLQRLDIDYEDENTVLGVDNAELAILELGHTVTVEQEDILAHYENLTADESKLKERPPVVTVMGHVDHGKTTLLDYIRKTTVVSKESGGITQHIGAYQIKGADGKKITFLDTPGHEAFAEMRARGAMVTDIIVLVVAADDGLKQQTIEVINHAKSAGVPIIVAINKMDKPNVDPMRVKTELLQHNIVVEDMGGKVLSVEISALKGTGVDNLLESILLEAELLEFKADYNRPAMGTIIESKLEKGKGIVATAIIQQGTLRQGDTFVVGNIPVKVRIMHNDAGKAVKEAPPSMPVEIMGFSKEVRAGDKLIVALNSEDVGKLVQHYEKEQQETSAADGDDDGLSLLMGVQQADKAWLPVIIKADVYGSKEAILGALEKIGNEEVSVKVIHSGVGAINDSDVLLAKTSGALVYGFNVRASGSVSNAACEQKVSIRYYSVIYDLLDDIKSALSGLLKPKIVENIVGYAQVKEVFNITKVGKIAGCMVTEGTIKRALGVRLLRDNVVVYEGTLQQLKHYKDDIKEASSGQECGIALQNFQDIQVGDNLECFERITEARQL